MATAFQRLKAYGHFQAIELKDVARMEGMIDTSLYAPILRNRFCSCPDTGDPSIADSTPGPLSTCLGLPYDECRGLIENHRRLLAKTGRGSFPVGCDPKYPNIHIAKYYVNVDSFNSHYRSPVDTSDLEILARQQIWGSREQIFDLYNGKSLLEVALHLCERTYLRRGIKWIRLDSPRGENMYIKSKFIPGSTIGYAYFNDGTCGSHSLLVIDNSWNRPLGPTTNLMGHEWGHVNDLPHVFRNQGFTHALMSYDPLSIFEGFSPGKKPYVRPFDPSIPQLINQYGDPLPEDDPTIIVPPANQITINGQLYGVITRGELEVQHNDVSQTFIPVLVKSGVYRLIHRIS